MTVPASPLASRRLSVIRVRMVVFHSHACIARRLKTPLLGFIAAALALVVHPAGATERMSVDLELLLAVDASGSVSADEFALQLGGIATAFRDQRIHDAIASGAEQRIAVALMIWSDAVSRKATTDWMVIDGPASAIQFSQLVSAQIARRGSFLGKNGTGIGSAIAHGVKMIRRNEFDGARRTIDVSGDGPETRLMFGEGIMLPEALKRARREDVLVNGLAILSDDPNLDIYYERRVISGPGAFVIAAADFWDFERAILRKLLREIQSLVGEAERPSETAEFVLRTATPDDGSTPTGPRRSRGPAAEPRWR